LNMIIHYFYFLIIRTSRNKLPQRHQDTKENF
jgi:hypothetical protein